MRAIKIAMLLTAIGTALCLWLLMGVTWYNFLAFMLLAQPLLLLGAARLRRQRAPRPPAERRALSLAWRGTDSSTRGSRNS